MLDTLTQGDPAFADDVLTGLSQPQKTVPCRWLYDERGSVLFEEITLLPEYYPTRTEAAILEACAADVASAAGPGATVVEYGAGASVKTRLLLDAMQDVHCYVPIDVSAEFLAESAARLEADYAGLQVVPVVSDFLSPIDLPAESEGPGPAVGFFPGSTVGNLTDEEIADFFERARRDLGDGASFVLGADLKKSADRLIPAYDDAAGVTAAFNLNLLARINRELGGTFDLTRFIHEARWNEARSRVEMHLVSQGTQTVRVCDAEFRFEDGETIHTENSRKFARGELSALAVRRGWETTEVWMDDDGLFSVMMLKAA
ncbi:MAG: L-histidine N(alpha)-methyltransferase [Parvibaculaceae bacterium]